MDEDVKRLLTIVKRAPIPFGKTDSELAQEYRSWFLGSRLNLKAAEQSFAPDAEAVCICGDELFAVNPDGKCAWCKLPRR